MFFKIANTLLIGSIAGAIVYVAIGTLANLSIRNRYGSLERYRKLRAIETIGVF